MSVETSVDTPRIHTKTINFYSFEDFITLKKEGFTFTSDWMKAAIKTNRCLLIIWLRNEGVDWCGLELNWAAKRGHVASLHLLKVLGAPWSDSALNYAAWNGHVQAVDLLYKQAFALIYNRGLFKQAAAKGYLEILKWFKTTLNDSLIDRKIMKSKIGHLAILNGNENVFLWLREIKASFDELSSAYAAAAGNLKFLQILRDGRVPWDERVRIWSAQERKWDVYIWAKENGAPVTPLTRGLIARFEIEKKTRS